MDVSPAAASTVEWPPSLRIYARKCFKNCSTEEDRDEVAVILKDKISEANISNTLWSINWGEEPLLTLPVLTGTTKSEEPPVGPSNTTVEQSQVAHLSAHSNLSDVCDEWGSDSEEETTGDLSLLFKDAEEGNLLSSESVSVMAPQSDVLEKEVGWDDSIKCDLNRSFDDQEKTSDILPSDVHEEGDRTDLNLNLSGVCNDNDSDICHDDNDQKVEASPLAQDPSTPKHNGCHKKHQSPASKSMKFHRLLRFQERLVKEKGLPRSRLQCQLDDVTPNPVKHCPEKTPKCTKNLLRHFQDLEASSCLGRPSATSAGRTTQSSVPSAGRMSGTTQSSAPSTGRTSGMNFLAIEASPCLYGAPAPFTARTPGPTTTTNVSNSLALSSGCSDTRIGQMPVNRVDTLEARVSPGEEQEVEGELEGVKNGDYSEVISRGQEKIFTRSYPRDESDHKDTLHSNIPSTTSSQMFYPPMSEAWISGYNVGIGVAAQVYCWGCRSIGFIVPSSALAH